MHSDIANLRWGLIVCNTALLVWQKHIAARLTIIAAELTMITAELTINPDCLSCPNLSTQVSMQHLF